jgi:hypothetical protein
MLIVRLSAVVRAEPKDTSGTSGALDRPRLRRDLALRLGRATCGRAAVVDQGDQAPTDADFDPSGNARP